MKVKKYLKYLIIALLAILIIPALCVALIDPLQLYHSQFTKKEKYFKEQRHQNIGLINKYLKRSTKNYSNVIVGTSLSENFIPTKFEKKLNNKKVLKIALSGGQPIEISTTLNSILKHKKVKTIYWEIGRNYILKNIKFSNPKHDFPYKLYSNNFFQQGYYYLFNNDYVKDSLNLVFNNENKSKWTQNLNTLNYWMNRACKNKKFETYGSLKNLNRLNNKIKKREIKFDDYKKFNFDLLNKYIISIIKKNKHINFKIFFPPYSTYYYRTYDIEQVKRSIYAKKYLIEKTKNLDNVTFYGFDNNYSIVNNIYNYKDYGHYRAEINDLIMNSLINNNNTLTHKNIDKYINHMLKNINTYNKVYYLNNEMKNLKLIKTINFNNQKYKSNTKINIGNNVIKLKTSKKKKFSYINFKLSKISNSSRVKLKIEYEKKDIKMFSITLKNGKNYAHFFITPSEDNGSLILKRTNISKQSKNFTFGLFTEITIRVYPKELNTEHIINITSLKFYANH